MVSFYIMSRCVRIDVTSDYEDIINKDFNEFGIRFIIVGIDLYSLGGSLSYCFQVQTKQFHKGKWQDGLYLNNLFENQFLSLLLLLRKK